MDGNLLGEGSGVAVVGAMANEGVDRGLFRLDGDVGGAVAGRVEQFKKAGVWRLGRPGVGVGLVGMEGDLVAGTHVVP